MGDQFFCPGLHQADKIVSLLHSRLAVSADEQMLLEGL
jgi:hypothetical protein